ncbi:radical SAM protein [candidate division GN15 bacterium]|nr:radical SAM protein [candidate division GN15 bacterium]
MSHVSPIAPAETTAGEHHGAPRWGRFGADVSGSGSTAKYTYGPVPSRRLGRSLGVSLIPHKTCSYSCVYCQLGRTRHPIAEPASFVPRDRVVSEIGERMAVTSPDFITFVGDGEPTLSSDLGWLIDTCKSRWSVPIAVITNGSLLFREDVCERLHDADVVLPSLDAGDPETFARINRPHPELDFDTVVSGLIDFAAAFDGRIYLEVMLVAGLNDTEVALRGIRKLAWAVHPERVDVTVPTRPPAERWVRPPEPMKILTAQRILHSAQKAARPENGVFDLAGFGTVREAIIGLSSRHPLRREQAQEVANAFGEPTRLEELIDEGELSVVAYEGVDYVAPSRATTDGGR